MTSIVATPCAHFRFLDLPKEVQLMIYERLPFRTVRSEFVESIPGIAARSFTLISFSAPTAVLATCQTVYAEARVILGKRIDQQLHALVPNILYPRIEANPDALVDLSRGYGLFEATKDYLRYVRNGHAHHPHLNDIMAKLETHIRVHLPRYRLSSGTLEQVVTRMLAFVRKTCLCFKKQIDHNVAHGHINAHGDFCGPALYVALLSRPTDTMEGLQDSAMILSDHIGPRPRMAGIALEVVMYGATYSAFIQLWSAFAQGLLLYEIENRNQDRPRDYPEQSVQASCKSIPNAERDKYWRDFEWL
jgi:hypothetical protein